LISLWKLFNSQYPQRNGFDLEALLAVAQVLKLLKTPLAEIESTLSSAFWEGMLIWISKYVVAH